MTDTWTWATVTQASPLRIKVDGDTSALDATTGDLVGSLAVDDRVRVHLHSDGIIVTGIQGGNDKVYMVAHPETDLPGAYPEGITMSDTSGGGWPSNFATVVTTAVNIARTSQVVYEKDGAERQWWRTGLGTTWTAWKETAGYESDGRLKAADGVAADDVATVGQTLVHIEGTLLNSALAATYAEGITLSTTNSGNGWPESWSSVVTYKLSNYVTQVLYRKNGPETHHRRRQDDGSWSSWTKAA